jgi:hypothetical protein
MCHTSTVVSSANLYIIGLSECMFDHSKKKRVLQYPDFFNLSRTNCYHWMPHIQCGVRSISNSQMISFDLNLWESVGGLHQWACVSSQFMHVEISQGNPVQPNDNRTLGNSWPVKIQVQAGYGYTFECLLYLSDWRSIYTSCGEGIIFVSQLWPSTN